MNIQENIPLAPFTTFKIGGPARFFCLASTDEDVVSAVAFARKNNLHIFVLGGGSNILVSDEGYRGLVIKMENQGVTFDGENVHAAASVAWDTLVNETVEQGLYGLENLSAIPGTVGAAPVQNIGAYGADISSRIASVRAYDTKTLKFVTLQNADCAFGYRDSIFKHEKGRFVITSVDFKLKKDGMVDISYRDLQEYFARAAHTAGSGEPASTSAEVVPVSRTPARPPKTSPEPAVCVARAHNPTPSLAAVRSAVIAIRQAKLPDWKKWGTAGSFFKNPIVSKELFSELKNKYPELPGFPEPDGRVKISLGWVLDKVCNVRGTCMGNVRVYEKQALVLVAKPGATAAEVVALSHDLIKRVRAAIGLEIEGEVEWVN